MKYVLKFINWLLTAPCTNCGIRLRHAARHHSPSSRVVCYACFTLLWDAQHKAEDEIRLRRMVEEERLRLRARTIAWRIERGDKDPYREN